MAARADSQPCETTDRRSCYVKSHELAVHSFFSSVKSTRNHMIPILDEVVLGIETIIAMPKELVLRDLFSNPETTVLCASS